MATLIHLYPLLKQLGLDDRKSQEFIDTLDTAFLEHAATKADVEKVHADLSVEIQKVRADLSVEIEKVRADLSVEIEKVRADLSVEIQKVRADLSVEIEKVRTTIEAGKSDTLRWMFGAWATLFLAILALLFK